MSGHHDERENSSAGDSNCSDGKEAHARRRRGERAESGKPQKSSSAYERALGLLARREHSRRELNQKLRAKGLAREEIEAAIEKLEAQRFQSDARFAAMLVRSRASAGYGPTRIRMELRQHGLSNEAIDAAIAEESPEWDNIAQALLAKRFREPASNPAERHKRAAFLLRRGFVVDRQTISHQTVSLTEFGDADAE